MRLAMKQREILINGKKIFTEDPSDYVIVYCVNSRIWKFICGNNIETLFVDCLKPYCIERYTLDQVIANLQFMVQWGNKEHKKFHKMLYKDFVKKTKSKYYVNWFNDIAGKIDWLETVECANWLNRMSERKMLAIFRAKKRMKNRGFRNKTINLFKSKEK